MPTSAKSKSSSKKAIDRPFEPALLRRAREIVEGDQIILHVEDGLYYGRGLERATVMNEGKTADACVRATRDIMTTAVAYMLESGQSPPSPGSENKRTEQINVRLTQEEKLLLEETARN